MKFKNYIEVQSGIKDSADSPGTLDQVLTSTATGVAWVDPSTISAEAAKLVAIDCKNTSGATIAKGTPVYQTGTVGATDVIEIAPADALISAGKQPAIGLLQTTLNNNGFGKVVVTGELLNITTDPIDGLTPTTGQKVFLKSGGGLTLTKPTGAGNGIQNLGLIGKVSGGNAGSITVSSIMRTNDVPNLPTGKIWVGDGNTIVSDTVFLDEPNGRMGIGTINPTGKLDVREANVTISTSNSMSDGIRGLKIEGTNAGFELAGSGDDWWVSALGSGLSIYDTTVDSYRFKILNNGNVGIGTTTPAEKLDVSGIVLANAFRTDVNTSDYSVISRSSAGNAPLYVQSADSNTNQPIAKFFYGNAAPNQGAIVLNVAKDETYFSNTNVGIGTTSPKRKLHVDNSSGVGEAVISGTTGATLYFRPNASYSLAGNFGIFTTGLTSGTYESTMDFKGYYNGVTTPLTIKGSGNVGIGTTNPTAKLEVTGSVGSFKTTGHQIFLTRNGNNEIYAVGASSVLALGQNNAEKMRIHSNGNVGIGTTNPLKKLHVKETSGTYEAAIFETNAGGSFIRSIDSTGSVETGIQGGKWSARTSNLQRLVIDSSGNVGIGTTNPGAQLHVYSTGNGELEVQRASGALFNVQAQASLATIGTDSNHPLYLKTNAGTRVAITTAGNVGIGTTSPGALLQVGGGASYNTLFHTFDQYNEVKFHGVSNQSASGVWQFINDGTWDQTRFYVQDANNVASRLTFRFTGNNGVNEILAGTSTGNVGIGTTTPGYTLDVNGSLHSTNINIADGIYHEGDTNTYMQFHANDQWRVVTNGTERLEVNNTEVTVANNLVVNGSIYASQYIYHAGDIDTYMRFPSNDTISWNTAGSERMRINSTGNVGIGTTAPESKLQVQGDITIKGLNTSRFIRFSEPTNSYQGGFINYDGDSNIFYFGTHNVSDQSLSNDVRAFQISRGSTATTFNGSLTIPSYIYHSGDTNTYMGFAANEHWRVTTNNINTLEVTDSEVLVNNSYFKIQNSGDRLMNVDTVNGTFFLGDVDGLSDENYIISENGRIDLVSGGGETLSCTTAGKVGIGDINPSTKLSVNGGVQIANESATASAALVGTIRYRSTTNTSFVDMCMQTGATTYTWVNIVSNFW